MADWRMVAGMYRILIPVDTDERRAEAQARTATRLADELEEVEAVILHVHEEIEHVPDEAGSSYIDELNERIDEIQGPPASLDVVEDALGAAGVETTVNRVIGHAAPAILELADEVDADAVLLGVRKRSPVGKVLFGSVTQAVILSSDRPTITAPVPTDEA